MDELYQKAKEGVERDRLFRKLLRDGAMGFGDAPRIRHMDPSPYVSIGFGPRGRCKVEFGLKGTF